MGAEKMLHSFMFCRVYFPVVVHAKHQMVELGA